MGLLILVVGVELVGLAEWLRVSVQLADLLSDDPEIDGRVEWLIVSVHLGWVNEVSDSVSVDPDVWSET